MGPVDDVKPGFLRQVSVDGVGLCVGRLMDGTLFAVDEMCTHEEVSLVDGYVDGDEVECPAHGSRFDVRTGAVTGEPARVPVRCFALRVEGEKTFVAL
ncbi:MAG: non-heme iron oxygenase ferredoxin subunit [Sporichthya sp.]|nr:non-heme iron oxygenase ferredoxin subunit [Sporichthya sp.]